MIRNKYGTDISWVLAQLILFGFILFQPFAGKMNLSSWVSKLGFILMALSGLLSLFSALSLKKNLRPFPSPAVGGSLVKSGFYRIVRHPVYALILLCVLGFSIWKDDAYRLILSVCLFFFFDAKTKVEEQGLEKMYPEYRGYKISVKYKFIPGIY